VERGDPAMAFFLFGRRFSIGSGWLTRQYRVSIYGWNLFFTHRFCASRLLSQLGPTQFCPTSL